MEYLIFKLHERVFAIKADDDRYKLVPTQINKMINLKNKENELIDGAINFKNKMYNVLDFSKIYNYDNLKKFDGLIFVINEKKAIAFKFEGFYKFVEELDTTTEIIDLIRYF